MNTNLIIFIAIALFLLAGRLRAYFRTGLKGNLFIILGLIMFILGFLVGNNTIETVFSAIGFIVLNIGLIILATTERAKVKDIYAGTSIIDRLTGNLPRQFKDKKYPFKVDKGITIKAGIFSVMLAIALYFFSGSRNIADIIVDGVLLLGGIIFIVTGLLSGKGDNIKQ